MFDFAVYSRNYFACANSNLNTPIIYAVPRVRMRPKMERSPPIRRLYLRPASSPAAPLMIKVIFICLILYGVHIWSRNLTHSSTFEHIHEQCSLNIRSHSCRLNCTLRFTGRMNYITEASEILVQNRINWRCVFSFAPNPPSFGLLERTKIHGEWRFTRIACRLTGCARLAETSSNHCKPVRTRSRTSSNHLEQVGRLAVC